MYGTNSSEPPPFIELQYNDIPMAPTGRKAKIMRYIDKVKRYQEYLRRHSRQGNIDIDIIYIKTHRIVYRYVKNLAKISYYKDYAKEDYRSVIRTLHGQYGIIITDRYLLTLFNFIYLFIMKEIQTRFSHQTIPIRDRIKIVQLLSYIRNITPDSSRYLPLDDMEEWKNNTDELI